MSSFDDRKYAAEAKFALDATNEFKAQARRNKALALWVAELLGKSGEDVDKYVLAVIASDMEEAGDDDVFRKVKKDLTEASVELSDTALREKMDALLVEVRAKILADG